MKTLKRYVKLYIVFVQQFIKSIVQSKVDLIIGFIGFIMVQVSAIVFLYLIFQRIPSINGWSFNQILFIYGFAQIPRGIDHLFTDNLWMLSIDIVINGKFDRYYLRPLNLFFQVICEIIKIDGLVEMIMGIIIVSTSSKGIITWDIGNISMLVLSVLVGATIYTSIKLFFASIAFWVKESFVFLDTVYKVSDFAKYPIEIYSKPVAAVIKYVIPFAFVGYIPAKYFIKNTAFFNTIGFEIIIAIVFIIISQSVFIKGSKIYESCGN